MLFIGGGRGGICNVRYPGGSALVCLFAAVLCGSPVTVLPYPMSIAGGFLLWVVCSLSLSLSLSIYIYICGVEENIWT